MANQVQIPALVVVSGPGSELSTVEELLASAGAKVPQVDGVVFDKNSSHGLPSYPDPITAEAAGHPNAGHTPGTPHPATLRFKGEDGLEERPNPVQHHGEAYEEDSSIAFLTVECGDPNVVERVLQGRPWIVRMHIAPHEHRTAPDPEQLLAEMDALMAEYRRQTSGN